MIIQHSPFPVPHLNCFSVSNFSVISGDTWTQIDTTLSDPDLRRVMCLAINTSDHIFAGMRLDYIYQSTDNGDNWIQLNPGSTNPCYTALTVNSTDHIFAGNVDEGIFRSTNNGASWTPVNTGLTSLMMKCLVINSVDHIFAGTQTGGVFRSTDNGDNWIETNSGLTGMNVNCFAVNSTDHVYVGIDMEGVFRSVNNGDDWTQINNGITSTDHIRALACDPNDYIYAGTLFTDDGVFCSTNNGDTWTNVSSGLTHPNILALICKSNGDLFAGTDGGGVFRHIESGKVDVDNKSYTPYAFELFQNFPNPFNFKTKIGFEINNQSQVILKIYDIIGHCIRTLVDEHKPAGEYTVNWDGRDQWGQSVSSGIYIYKIKISNKGQSYIESKKAILLK